MNIFSRILGRGARESADARNAWLHKTTHLAASAALDQLQGHRRSFTSAERPAWVASMPTYAGNINDELAAKLPTMRGTAKAAARNNEWAKRYLKALPDNVLGATGIGLHMVAQLPNGELDETANAVLEQFFAAWCERGVCEVTGRYNWQEVEELLLGALPRSGEFLLRHRWGSGPLGYQVQLLPAELIDVSLRREWQGRRVRMGVEITDDGTAVAYWIRGHKAGDPTSADSITTVGQHVRIPAEQLVHAFEADEVEQLRGIPWLDAGARNLWLLGEFQEAVAVASGNAAKREGFFVSPDGNAPPGIADTIVSSVLQAAQAQGKTLTPEEIAQITATAQKYATTVPGQYDTLPTGYDFRPYDSKWPDIAADAHIKSHLRAWASARGMSYHTLGNDLADVNYSSAQVGIADERAHFQRVQQRFIGWLHQAVWPHVLQQALLRERALKPSRRDAYLKGSTWQPPVPRPIDPLKSAEADDVSLRNRSTSRRRIWMSRGLDPDEMQAEILREEAVFGVLDKANPKPADTTAQPTATAGKGG